MLERTLQRQRPPLPAGPKQRQSINSLQARYTWPEHADEEGKDDADAKRENIR
jgi:hypothetical protein